jgi:uncharacterized Ntn-hydrolase superfamily protein
MKRIVLAVALLGVVEGYSPRAEATYSIVATHQTSRQVGGAGASCVGEASVYAIIYGVAPNYGAVHAQALSNTEARDTAVEMLADGIDPEVIVAAITSPEFDSEIDYRQYGVVDLEGGAAGYTGAANAMYAWDLQGIIEEYTYSVQGNTLTSAEVIDSAEEAFTEEGCDLADRLMRALEAGGADGQGDSRCTDDGIPADSGFVHVDLEDGADFLHIEVVDTSPENPLILLREQYDAWRLENPCPGEEDPPDGGEIEEGTDAGADGGEIEEGTDAGADGGEVEDDIDAGEDGGEIEDDIDAGGDGGQVGNDIDAGPTAEMHAADGACSCSAVGGRATGSSLGLLCLLFLAMWSAVVARTR